MKFRLVFPGPAFLPWRSLFSHFSRKMKKAAMLYLFSVLLPAMLLPNAAAQWFTNIMTRFFNMAPSTTWTWTLATASRWS
jgi:hypothetical protein